MSIKTGQFWTCLENGLSYLVLLVDADGVYATTKISANLLKEDSYSWHSSGPEFLEKFKFIC